MHAPPSNSASSLRLIWRGFLRGSAGAGTAVMARGVGAVALNKLFAVLAPAGGLTLLAQFQNLMALITALPTDGVQVGLVKYLAPLRPGSARYRLWLGAATALNAAAILLGLALIAWRGQMSGSSLLLFGLGIALTTLQTMLGVALLAAGWLRAFVSLSVALAALGTAGAAAALLARLPLEQALLSYLLAQGLSALPALLMAGRAGVLRGLQWFKLPSRAALRGLGQFLLMAVGSLLFGKAVDYVLRAHLLKTYGPGPTDLWQAVAKVSDNYTLVFAAVMNSVFYPRLSALSGIRSEARAYVHSILALLAPAAAVVLGLIYLGRDWLLPVLFAPRMLAARELMGPQLLGDWAKFLSWIFIYQLMARARTGPYIAVQAASAVVFAGLLAVLLPRLGIGGAVWAHAARYGLVLLACVALQMAPAKAS